MRRFRRIFLLDLFPKGLQTKAHVGVGLLKISRPPRIGNVAVKTGEGKKGGYLVPVLPKKRGQISAVVFIHNNQKICLVALVFGESLGVFSLLGDL